MSNYAGERIADYLEAHRFELLTSWMDKVMVQSSDPYWNVVKTNGSFMLDLVISCARELRFDDDALQELALKVSSERIKANSSIGDFVYNVSIGRSEIVDHSPRMGLTMAEVQSVFTKINILFDKFLYFAVDHYTETKSREFAAQSSFIEQSHKDKLTILGQMSSSFVHEFRNPLTSVIGFIQLLREKYPSLEYIDVITKELNELRFRINQFLLVSKRGDEHREQVQFALADVVDETLDFLYPMVLNANANILQDVDRSVCIKGYPDEIRQVVINIIMNSLDALSTCTDKEIAIEGHADSGHVVLSISNNGPAIPSDMMSTIFEPFVTSKELGTGIGLYLCQKIVMHHSGVIECNSNDDLTTFRIDIPMA